MMFADLSGFTTLAERMDPEDVKAIGAHLSRQLGDEVARFGGTTVGFMGDAIMAVFGAPIAHEDDAERAVRCALAMQLSISPPDHLPVPFHLHVGINTGEVMAGLVGTEEHREYTVMGDVTNTAARLQTAAEPGQILVGRGTYEATNHAIDYEEVPPIEAKGKRLPVRAWVALRVRGRPGGRMTSATPFVGRKKDLSLLQGICDKVARAASLQLVTVVGEPGVGKSRMLAELSRHLGAAPDIFTWRQGRCLPYGEGVTFWALGEIVKAHAGIMDSDPPEGARAKLDAAISNDEPDREWMKQRLGPLVGLEATSGGDREETFTAWRRFLESIAASGPAVFVFEDIHWADQALLEFIEHMVESSSGFPLLLICTARPDLYEKRSGWAAGAANSTRIGLSPLTADDTARLVSGLLDQGVLPADLLSLLLERAEGNPLYAEEFVSMLKDQGLLVHTGVTWRVIQDAEVRFPESIQSLIAARLDTLAPAHKAALQDASVIGRVFWSGAVASIGERDEGSLREALDELLRKDLILLEAPPAIEGETQYAFWHALVRDVCYSQIPKASRATRHRAAALWIEQVAGERLEDLAEVLAHHYITALGLASAAGRKEEARELEAGTLRFLVLAGDRALGLDVARAEQHYARALELAPPGHRDRPDILAKWAEGARQSGQVSEAARALEEAIETFKARGDVHAAARTMGTLSSVLLVMGSARQEEVALAAVELLQSGAPGADLVAAYSRMAGVKLVQGDPGATVAWADRATALAADLELDVPARTLGFRGYALCSMGHADGIGDMRKALELATERGEGRDAAVLYNNLAVAVWPIEGPVGVLAVLREGIEFSERRGIQELATAMSAASLDQLAEAGDWDRALELAESIAEKAESSGDVADLLQARWTQTRLFASRGEADRAAALADWLVGAARNSGGVEDVIAGFAGAAQAYAAVGQSNLALGLLSEVDAAPYIRESPTYPAFLCEMVRTAIGAGDESLAARLVDGVEPIFTYHQHALCAAGAILEEARQASEEAAASYGEAAERWRSFGVVPERGHALLGHGRCLLALRRADDAIGPLREAQEIFSGLGARPGLAEVNALLQKAASRAS